ncbi:transcription factor HES-5-like [Meleagris gallopavo]|nr:transcription factor HES-5-like [Meleagris gallopavo]
MSTFPTSGRSWIIMMANAFPRSYPSALMPGPIVSHTPQSTCSFGSRVLSPGNSQSIYHAVIDAVPIVLGHTWIGYLDCGKLKVALDPYICMQLLRINRGTLHCFPHRPSSQLRADSSSRIMAPSALSLEILTPKEKNRLRKPIVEKLRRDRINSSIEQLKVLLEKEFQRHQPNSKLEKADILEMTVSYLKYSRAFAASAKSLQQDYCEGYAWCLKEALQFLSLHSANTETQMKLIYHFQRSQAMPKDSGSPAPTSTHQPSAKQAPAKPSCNLWRPW